MNECRVNLNRVYPTMRGLHRICAQQRATGFVRNVRESVGRGAGDTRTPVHAPVVLLPPATPVEGDALEELPARDLVLHLLLYAAGRVAGEWVVFFDSFWFVYISMNKDGLRGPRTAHQICSTQPDGLSLSTPRRYYR